MDVNVVQGATAAAATLAEAPMSFLVVQVRDCRSARVQGGIVTASAACLDASFVDGAQFCFSHATSCFVLSSAAECSLAYNIARRTGPSPPNTQRHVHGASAVAVPQCTS